jgi:LmbE family N-acetylglucosaminyl deacetylase
MVVDITSVVDRKLAALAAHRTAGVAMNLEATLGLNRWRSLACRQGDGYAEAFLASPGPTWPAILSELGRPSRRDREPAEPPTGPR